MKILSAFLLAALVAAPLVDAATAVGRVTLQVRSEPNYQAHDLAGLLNTPASALVR